MGSISHGSKIHFWDISYLHDEEEVKGSDKEGESDSDAMSDSDDEKEKPSKVLPTPNERFFADL